MVQNWKLVCVGVVGGGGGGGGKEEAERICQE